MQSRFMERSVPPLDTRNDLPAIISTNGLKAKTCPPAIRVFSRQGNACVVSALANCFHPVQFFHARIRQCMLLLS